MTVEASITSLDDAARTLSANGYLIVDGRAIYSMEFAKYLEVPKSVKEEIMARTGAGT